MKRTWFLWVSAAGLTLTAIALAGVGCDQFNPAPLGATNHSTNSSAGDTSESYTILLCPAFDGSDHVRLAAEAKRKTEAATKWSGVYVVHEDVSSCLYMGRYASPEEAQADLKKAHQWRTNDGTQSFRLALVTKRPGERVGPPEWDLANAVDPNGYTVVIAEFYNVPQGGFTARKELAVENCKLLRQKDVEAYYHHGPTKSFVTIGMFPASAFRMEPTPDGKGVRAVVNSDGIQKVMKERPKLAVNGREEKVPTGMIEPATGKPRMVFTPTYVQPISEYIGAKAANPTPDTGQPQPR
jgi:hypothetical protein